MANPTNTLVVNSKVLSETAYMELSKIGYELPTRLVLVLRLAWIRSVLWSLLRLKTSLSMVDSKSVRSHL